MILVLFIVVIVGASAHAIFSDALQDEVKNNNELLLRHMVVNMEKEMEEIRQIIYQTSLSVDVDVKNQINLLEVSKTLKRIKGTQKFLDDVFVYYEDRSRIMTDSGIFYTDYFFEQMYSPAPDQREQLLHGIQSRNDFQEWGMVKLGGKFGEDRNFLVVLSSFPLYNKGINGTIVILIDESKFLSIIENMDASKGQTGFFVLNAQQQILMESSQQNIRNRMSVPETLELLERSDSESTSNMVRYNSEFVSRFESKVMNWKYVAFTSADQIFHPIELLRNIVITISVFLLVTGAILSLYLARNFSMPIVDLVRRFDLNSGRKRPKKMSEFEVISNHIQYIMERNRKLMQRESEHESFAADYYAKSMILGASEGHMKSKIISATDLRNPLFTVIVVKATEMSVTAFNQMSMNKKLIDTFKNYLNDEQHIRSIVTDIGRDQISILANYKQEYQLMAKLKLAVEPINEWLPPHYSITLGIGGSYDELDKVNHSYEEALEALLHRITEDRGKVQLVNQQDIKRMQRFVDYPIDLEQQIIGSVFIGDYEKTEQLMDQVIRSNIGEAPTYNILNDLFRLFMATAYKIVQKSKLHSKELFDEAVISIHMNKEIINMDSLKDATFGVFRYMIEGINANKKSKNESLKHKIIEYVEENYDKDLSLTNIAGDFQLNPKYVSRFFKDQTGVNFVKYLHNVRIEHAKRILMEEQDVKIDKVGERVGYININTFFSSFKKLVGMPPGKFRELSNVEQAEHRDVRNHA